MKIFIILCLTLYMPFCFADDKGDVKGTDLVRWCNFADRMVKDDAQQLTDNERTEGVSCMSYIYGFRMSNMISLTIPNAKSYYCEPENVNNGQALLIFLKFTKDHPEFLHYSGGLLLTKALQTAFPCKK